MLNHLRAFIAAVLLSASPMAAIAATITDAIPAPVPSASNTNSNSEFNIQSYSVTGGTLYCSTLRQAGIAGSPLATGGCAFASGTGSTPTRYQALSNAKCDSAVAITGTATGGCVGIARTAGTSIDLAGETTSSNAKTDKAMWEFSLADTYVAGSAIPVTVNSNFSGGGTVTAASCTMTLTAYSVSAAGVETALTVTAPASILITSSAAPLVYSIAGTGLSPGSHIEVELAMLITSASGSNTGQINSIALNE